MTVTHLRPASPLRREDAPDLVCVHPRRCGGVLHAHEAVAHEPAERLERALGLSCISSTTPPMAVLPSSLWAFAAVGPL